MKFLKGFPRKSLGENVYKHVLGGHVIKFNFMVFDLFVYKIMPNVNMLGSRVRH